MLGEREIVLPSQIGESSRMDDPRTRELSSSGDSGLLEFCDLGIGYPMTVIRINQRVLEERMVLCEAWDERWSIFCR